MNKPNKLERYILLTFIVGLYIGYIYGNDNMNIRKAYNYIVDNPSDYINYVRDTYEKNKTFREKCIEDIDNCPAFIEDKKRIEKEYKNDPEEMENAINKLRENRIDLFSYIAPVEEFTIDAEIGDYFSTKNREFKDTADVIYNY